MPSSSPSNRCGSGGRTLNRRYEISPQAKSGGDGGMQTVGYEGSQMPLADGVAPIVGGAVVVGGDAGAVSDHGSMS